MIKAKDFPGGTVLTTVRLHASTARARVWSLVGVVFYMLQGGIKKKKVKKWSRLVKGSWVELCVLIFPCPGADTWRCILEAALGMFGLEHGW